MASLLQTALELGFISSLTVLALYLSYSMLDVCDLSTDGAFTLGACVGAVVGIAAACTASVSETNSITSICGVSAGAAVLSTGAGSVWTQPNAAHTIHTVSHTTNNRFAMLHLSPFSFAMVSRLEKSVKSESAGLCVRREGQTTVRR